jgi:DNA polymerase bacteriophage-type
VTTLYFDCETFSECDLFKAGTHAYAEHPSTEITIAQWALDDGEPVVEDLTEDPAPSLTLLDHLGNPTIEIVAHFSHFDRTLIRHCWGIDVPPERWRDTGVKALAHGLPGGLDKVGAVLKLEADQAKDKRGKELIQLFCKPRPKNHTLRRATRETHPAEWAEFLEYSRQDIVAMRAIDRKLPQWNYAPGRSELALWHLDQRINDRGFAVDVDLAHAAIAAVKDAQADLKEQIVEATGGVLTSASRRDQLLVYILAEYGVSLPDMRADTLRRRMEDPELPDAVKLLLAIRLESTKTSTAKYNSLVRAVSSDGRLRNTMQFAGAQRTARWAGRLFQPQNMPRPDMDADDIDLGILALKAGVADILGDVMRLTANAVRGCIIAPPGRKLVVADLSNIEGRGLAYLAGERWKLKAFAEFDQGTGADLYKLAYARAFNISVDQVDKLMRQIGKVMELGLGYGGGVAAFITFAVVYGLDLEALADAVHASAPPEWLEKAHEMLAWFKKKKRSTLGLNDHVWTACEALVLMWRGAHPNTQALWDAADDGVRQAIERPGETFSIGQHLRARVDGAWLRLRLPSGRYLCYTQPEVNEKGEISYMGVDHYTRQWKRVKTYGGKLIENCTQAFARDIMAHNMAGIEANQYDIVLSVHDELLTETPDTDEFNHQALSDLLSTVPPWAAGIPLAAAGFEATRYRKD